ncbi:MAG: Sensor histidine kinase RcsC [Syntrophus sp. SKADARSKE-3]|nr:Sensor histidine kinase RcsC [Syntrophus sp. SKADARSKE-3]
MNDPSKTYQELIEENDLLRQRIQDLEYLEAKHRQTAEALKESEANYRQLFDNSPAGIYRVDFKSGKFIKANDVFCRYLGCSREEITYLSPYDVLTEESKKLFLERLRKMALGEEVPETVEYRIIGKNGKQTCVSLHNKNIYDAEGRVIASDVVAHDITERKQMEDALRESEKRYRFLLENTTDYVSRYSLAGILLFVTDAIYSMIGYRPEEIIGTSGFIRVHPDDKSQVRAALTEAIETGEPQKAEYRTICKNGEYKWVEMSGRIVQNNQTGEKEIVAVVRDISTRKRMEETLRASESKYRQLHQSMMDAFVSVDMDGHIKDYNESYMDMLGYSPDEIGNLTYKDITPDKWHSIEDAIVKKQILTRGYSDIYEKEYRKKDGTVLPVELRTALLRDAGGTPLSMWAIVRDISARKRAEAEKAAFEDQKRQLHKTESLSRMAGAIGHYFNNKLGVVMGNLEMVINELPESSELQENLSESMNAVSMAADVTKLMLTYLGQSSDIREPIDLSETCSGNIQMLLAGLPVNVSLKSDFIIPGPVVSIDANQIQQVLINLVTNAWEAIGENRGSIHMRIKKVSRSDIPALHRFPIDWQPHDEVYACLEVADSGIGIAEQDMENLFDPFFSDKFTGRGMGLPVVLGIVKTHGGAVTVNSKRGHGSIVRIFLPVFAGDVSRMTDRAVPAPDIEIGGTLLLVDDDAMLRNMAAAMIKRLGFKVVEAKDGVEALKIFEQHRNEIRCVLTDLTMPQMNGWETLTALRKLEPGIPVILASGYDAANVMAGDHPEKPQTFLGKPYKIKELSEAIQRALSDC